ncbi:hypothetical protein U9M48_032462 [Paspalum notatum var. saurae]|uniref:Carbonic anhydrase n=1 Tax=Paspalum notatum var. saurae TaxID=547442 RepID=A0AAQ3U583_PASNO
MASSIGTGNAALLLLLSACCAVVTALACDPNDGGGAKFGYVGSVGPDHWGALSPNFTRCASGTSQSPIDISTAAAVVGPALEPLRREYTVANATLVDNVVNVALRFDDAGTAGSVSVGGKVYRLKQAHWHSPSEHTVDGRRFPVELHMVHASDDGNVSVVAVLYRFGKPDPFVWQIQDKLGALYAEGCDATEKKGIPTGDLSLWPLRLDSHAYYRYVGSFTTPPCTENVVWSVRDMSVDQAAALMAPLEQDYRRNNRPTQPMNGRVVQFYRFTGNKKQAP